MTATELAREGLAKGHTGRNLEHYVAEQWQILTGKPISDFTLRLAIMDADRRA